MNGRRVIAFVISVFMLFGAIYTASASSDQLVNMIGKVTSLTPNSGKVNGNKSVAFKWQMAANAAGHEVQFYNSKGKFITYKVVIGKPGQNCWWNVSPWGYRCQINLSRLNSSSLPAGTTQWRVRGYAGSSYGPWSSWVTIKIEYK
ncbi:MAG: hypothetical protein HY866_18265 [Chloroflexi bacterium]|nr:hypothetical protein [Chloroflexota bacterium]